MSNIEVSMAQAETIALALYELKLMIEAQQHETLYTPVRLTGSQLRSTLKDIDELDKMIKIIEQQAIKKPRLGLQTYGAFTSNTGQL